jgi:hypothetical protein
MKNNKQINLQDLKAATTTAATNLFKAKKSAKHKLPNGTLKLIVSAAEVQYKLPEGGINANTITTRVKRNNLGGIAHQMVSPFIEVKPLFVSWCERMAEIGMALNQDNVLGLVEDLIEDTTYATKLEEFKKKRNLKTRGGGRTIVGVRWYKSFMKQNKDKLKRARCKIKDQKRRIWCTYKFFLLMYDGVYSAMVEANIVDKLDREIIYDVSGNKTDDVKKWLDNQQLSVCLTQRISCLWIGQEAVQT